MKKILPFLLLTCALLPEERQRGLFAQQPNRPQLVAGYPVNYSEDSVGTYTLPDLLSTADGQKVADAKTWQEKRRPELLRLVESIQYGKMPPRPRDLHFEVAEEGVSAFNGKAIRKQVTVYFTKDTSQHKMMLLIYLPVNATKPSPLLLNISFSANNQVVNDPGVRIGEIWTREGEKDKG